MSSVHFGMPLQNKIIRNLYVLICSICINYTIQTHFKYKLKVMNVAQSFFLSIIMIQSGEMAGPICTEACSVCKRLHHLNSMV